MEKSERRYELDWLRVIAIFMVFVFHSGRFLQSKVLRLLVPLVVGIFTHIPVQVYLERRTHHQFYGTFWEFVPHYFDGVYGWGRGNFAIMGMHLWYLLVLFLFTVAFTSSSG